MTNEEAIMRLEALRALSSERSLKTIGKAIDMAIDALSVRTTGDPLTMERLREMDGQPVFIDDKKEPENTGWVIWSDSFNRNWTEGKDGEEYGKTWLAYAYPPAHIDREAWEPCWLCSISNEEPAKHLILPETCNGEAKYCPECGRPLTPEAWSMLEKRLRG